MAWSRGVFNLALVSIFFLSWVCLTVTFRNDLWEANRANFSRDPRRPVDGVVEMRTYFTWKEIQNNFYNVDWGSHRYGAPNFNKCWVAGRIFIVQIVFAWLALFFELILLFLRIVGKQTGRIIRTDAQGLAIEFALVISAAVLIVTAVVTEVVGCFMWEFIEDNIYSKFVPTNFIYLWLTMLAMIWAVVLFKRLKDLPAVVKPATASKPTTTTATAMTTFSSGGSTTGATVIGGSNGYSTAAASPPPRPAPAAPVAATTFTPVVTSAPAAAPALPPRHHHAPEPAAAAPALPPRHHGGGGGGGGGGGHHEEAHAPALPPRHHVVQIDHTPHTPPPAQQQYYGGQQQYSQQQQQQYAAPGYAGGAGAEGQPYEDATPSLPPRPAGGAKKPAAAPKAKAAAPKAKAAAAASRRTSASGTGRPQSAKRAAPPPRRV